MNYFVSLKVTLHHINTAIFPPDIIHQEKMFDIKDHKITLINNQHMIFINNNYHQVLSCYIKSNIPTYSAFREFQETEPLIQCPLMPHSRKKKSKPKF